MADTGKKTEKFKFKFEVDLMNKKDVKDVDFHKENREWLAGQKAALKYVKPLKFEVDAELDSRKWNEKKIQEEGFYGFRMAIKMFDQAVHEAKEKNDPGSIKSAYKDLEKDADYGFEKWLKDVESGKADNAKNLKECGNAFKQIADADMANVFKGPREAAVAALESLLTGGSRGPDDKKKEEAKKKVETAISDFEEHAAEVADAIDTVLKAAKGTQSNKDADGDLKAFAKKVEKEGKNMTSVVDDAAKFKKALNAVKEGLDDDDMEASDIRAHVTTLKGFSSLDKVAKDAEGEADALNKEFKKIEKNLK